MARKRKDPRKIVEQREILERMKRSDKVSFDIKLGLLGARGIGRKLRRQQRPKSDRIQKDLKKLGF